MLSPEKLTLSALIEDHDPYDLIQNHLVPAPYEYPHPTADYPGEALRYFVDGLPEVVVRHSQDCDEATMLHDLKYAHYRLRSDTFKIATLPCFPVVLQDQDGQDQTYVFTERLHGVTLDSMLSSTMPNDVVVDVDSRWASISNYYLASLTAGGPVVDNVMYHDGHMYGTTASRQRQSIIFANLGNYVIDYSADHNFDSFLIANQFISNQVVEIEQALGKPHVLTQSRQAIGKTLLVAEASLDKHNIGSLPMIRRTKRTLLDCEPWNPFD